MEFNEEVFCDTARKSSCYIKYILKNTGNAQINQKFSIALRTGKEISLICGDGCDQYGDYNPIEDNRISTNPSTWKYEKCVYTDGERVLTQLEGEAPLWNENEGFIDFNFVLGSGEDKVITFVLNKGEDAEKVYDAAKKQTELFWRKELGRLNKLPASR